MSEQPRKEQADRFKEDWVKKLGLEEIVQLTNKIGMEFVTAKQQADELELLKPVRRAQAMNRYDDGKTAETKIKRLAEIDAEYVQFLIELNKAKAAAEKLKVRYESYKSLFEARRSMLSYHKAEMSML